MASKAGAAAAADRQLPSKEAALFRQLAKQYEVSRWHANGDRWPSAGAWRSFGCRRHAMQCMMMPPARRQRGWRRRARDRVGCDGGGGGGASRPCQPLHPWPARLLTCPQTKQYKKGIKNADAILKKFPEHGETLAMKVRQAAAASAAMHAQ